ncbi:MAG: transcription antitermination factor NusB [Victivallaceae bacterium]|jgi:N utilization substance protein B
MSATQQQDNPVDSRSLGRELAMQFLFQQELNHCDATEEVFNEFFEQTGQSLELKENRYFRKAREYAMDIIAGVVKNLKEIDAQILAHSQKWDLKRMAVVDLNIMRVAIYEMLFVMEVPPVVSINEAVKITRDYSGEPSCGFMNGMLNAVKDSLDRPARKAAGKP